MQWRPRRYSGSGASNHRDGRILARILQQNGFDPVYASSDDQVVRDVQAMMRLYDVAKDALNRAATVDDI